MKRNLFSFLGILFLTLTWTFSLQAHEDSDQRDQSRFFLALSERNKALVQKELNLFKDNFRLIDSLGKSQSLYQYSTSKLIVIAAYASDQGSAQFLYHAAESLMSSQQGQIAWLWLNPKIPQNRQTVNQEIGEKGFAPVLMDYSQLVSKSFAFEKVGDVVVINPKDWSIPYRGHILDDGFWKVLHEADPQVSRGRWSTFTMNLKWKFQSQVEMPYQDFSQIKADEHLISVLYKNCVFCHERHESTDYFLSLDDFSKKLAMNQKVMRMFLMPPGGTDYSDDNECVTRYAGKVEEDDLRLIANWLANGAPLEEDFQNSLSQYRKSGADKIQKDSSRFKSPDLIWEMKEPHVIPADGNIDYQYAQIAGPLKEDLSVEAVNAQINLYVAHHVNILSSPVPLSQLDFKNSQGTMILKQRKKNQNDLIYDEENAVFSYSRFSGLAFAPKGTVFFFPKGSYVIAETHYAPSGRVETNKMKFEVYLHKPGQGPEPKIYRRTRIFIPEFVLQPHQKDLHISKDYEVKTDMTLMQIVSHMHYRGVSYRFKIFTPEGVEQPLCNIPFYQFKYEISSVLRKPHFLKKGSRIRVEIDYDNSEENISNPNPNIAVPSGARTEDQEMAMVRFWYVEGEFKP